MFFSSLSEPPLCILPPQGHTASGPRLPYMCIPTGFIPLPIPRPASVLSGPSDIKWWGNSSKAHTFKQVHPQQGNRWRCASVAESEDAPPKLYHWKCQACLAAREGQPVGCCLCWLVDLSHCYLLSWTRKVGRNSVCSGEHPQKVLIHAEKFYKIVCFCIQVEENRCHIFCPLVPHASPLHDWELHDWCHKLDGHCKAQYHFPQLPRQLCCCSGNSQTTGSEKSKIWKVRIWAVMFVLCFWMCH